MPAETTQTAPTLPPAQQQAEPRARILIVDDQRNMRTTTALVLRQAGYDVAEAETGESALSRLLADGERGTEFHLILPLSG